MDLLSADTPKKYKIGAYVAIAAGIVIFAALVFYLGLRRGRTGTWKFWRDGPTPYKDTQQRPMRRGSSRHSISDPWDWEKDIEDQATGGGGGLGSSGTLRSRPTNPTRPSIRHLGTAPGTGIGDGNGVEGYGYPPALPPSPGIGGGPLNSHLLPTDMASNPNTIPCFEVGIPTPRRQTSPTPSPAAGPPVIRELASGAIYEMGSGIRSTEMVNAHPISPRRPGRDSRKRWSSLLKFTSTSHFSPASSIDGGSVPPPISRGRKASNTGLSTRNSTENLDVLSEPQVITLRYPETGILRPSARPSADLGNNVNATPTLDPGHHASYASYLRSENAAAADNASTSGGGMNWEGLEWIRRIYRYRGSIYRASWRMNGSMTDLQRRGRPDTREIRESARDRGFV